MSVCIRKKAGESQALAQLNLLTIKEVAAYARVSVSTVRRWLRRKQLRSYSAGRQKRIDEAELVAFLSGA